MRIYGTCCVRVRLFILQHYTNIQPRYIIIFEQWIKCICTWEGLTQYVILHMKAFLRFKIIPNIISFMAENKYTGMCEHDGSAKGGSMCNCKTHECT